jgi:iron complex outermembrane receptor protein
MRHLFLSAASISMMVASSAAAQTKPASGPDAVPVIEEVVVTAQRKEETLRDVPATISAVTAAQLDAMGPVTGTGDLLRTMPGVRFNDLQSNNLSEISIRGSGTQRATGADSGVGLFVNGAYVGSSTLGGRNFRQMDFFDLERVEVLEGPQGALYGRNSEYGVVNIVSAKPKFNDSGYLNATYTDKLSQTKVSAVVNQQLSDTVAVRLGAQTIGQGKGFYYNPNSRKYYDHTDGWIARGQLRYRKGPLDIDFSVDAQDLNLPTFLNTYVAPPGANAALPLGLTQDRFRHPARRQGRRASEGPAGHDPGRLRSGLGQADLDQHGDPLDLVPGLRGGRRLRHRSQPPEARPAGSLSVRPDLDRGQGPHLLPRPPPGR